MTDYSDLLLLMDQSERLEFGTPLTADKAELRFIAKRFLADDPADEIPIKLLRLLDAAESRERTKSERLNSPAQSFAHETKITPESVANIDLAERIARYHTVAPTASILIAFETLAVCIRNPFSH